jgi:hypothetical protein
MPSARLLRLALLVLLAAAGSAATALPWSEVQLREIAAIQDAAGEEAGAWVARTPRFVVRSEVDARFSAEMARYLELFADAADQALDLPVPRERQPAEVTVYASRDRYQAGIGKQACSRGQFDWSYADADAAPVYTIRTFVANAGERSFAGFCLPILNHEITHYLLQLRAGRHRIPDAVHEGVASYMQAWDPFHDVDWNHAHRPSAFAADLRRAVGDGSLPSFAFLTVVSSWDVDGFGPLTNARYASAESFVAFLACAPQRLAFMRRLLDTAFAGGDVAGIVMSPSGAQLEGLWRKSLGLPR